MATHFWVATRSLKTTLLDEQEEGDHLPFSEHTGRWYFECLVICTEKNQGKMSVSKDK
jgi:hypothetical protein